MTEHDPEMLSEEEAARLWGRAAQLQAEAAGRIEAPEVRDVAMPSPGYALTHVRSAALEAGIGGEFVEAALADLRAERSLPTAQKGSALARRFLHNPPDTLTVRRVLDVTPQQVLSVMEAVFPEEPFRLILTDQKGDPLDRGVLVFDIQGAGPLAGQGFNLETREAGLRQVFVSLRPIDGSSSCEMTVYSPVTSHKLGLALGTAVTTVAGGVGLGVGLAGGGALVALGLATVLAPIAAVGGAVLGVSLGLKGYRALYRFALRRGRKALESLVGAVAVRTKGVWGGS